MRMGSNHALAFLPVDSNIMGADQSGATTHSKASKIACILNPLVSRNRAFLAGALYSWHVPVPYARIGSAL